MSANLIRAIVSNGVIRCKLKKGQIFLTNKITKYVDKYTRGTNTILFACI